MGYSRDSFYRFKDLYDKGGELALQEMSRRKPILKNRVAPEIEVRLWPWRSTSRPGDRRGCRNELAKQGISISPFGVCSVWLRHDLQTMKHRLKALEAKMAQDGLILDRSAGRNPSRRPRPTRRPTANSSPECLGYCGAQDTFYVGIAQGRRTRLPADLRRHLRQSRLRQAL